MNIIIKDGDASILRFKFSEVLSQHGNRLLILRNPNDVQREERRIGEKAAKLARYLRGGIPRIQSIGFRSQQVIMDIYPGNKWTEEEEKKAKGIVNALFHTEAINWYLKRGIDDPVERIRDKQEN